jgi:hypothetical protein
MVPSLLDGRSPEPACKHHVGSWEKGRPFLCRVYRYGCRGAFARRSLDPMSLRSKHVHPAQGTIWLPLLPSSN